MKSRAIYTINIGKLYSDLYDVDHTGFIYFFALFVGFDENSSRLNFHGVRTIVCSEAGTTFQNLLQLGYLKVTTAM